MIQLKLISVIDIKKIRERIGAREKIHSVLLTQLREVNSVRDEVSAC
jgi:hypothetical protein